jgi:chromosomal replication initiation ATPase DnaA
MTNEVFDNLCKKTAEITGIDVRFTRRRTREIIHAKAGIINVLNKYHGLNTVQIGRCFDLNHSTVIHHLRDHPYRYRYEDEYARIYDSLTRFSLEGSSNAINVERMVGLMKESLVF